MRILDSTLLKLAAGFGLVFLFRIAAAVGFLSARWQAEGVIFRWQVWLLAFVLTIGLRDLMFHLKPHEDRA